MGGGVGIHGREGGKRRREGERLCFQTVQHNVRLVKGAAFLHSPSLTEIYRRTRRWQENEQGSLA